MIRIDRIYGTSVVELPPSDGEKKPTRSRYVAPPLLEGSRNAVDLMGHSSSDNRQEEKERWMVQQRQYRQYGSSSSSPPVMDSHHTAVRVYQCFGSTVPQRLVRDVFGLGCAGPTVQCTPQLLHVVSEPPTETEQESLHGGSVVLVTQRPLGVSLDDMYRRSDRYDCTCSSPTGAATPFRIRDSSSRPNSFFGVTTRTTRSTSTTPPPPAAVEAVERPFLDERPDLLVSAAKQLLELATELLERTGIHHRGWSPENILVSFTSPVTPATPATPAAAAAAVSSTNTAAASHQRGEEDSLENHQGEEANEKEEEKGEVMERKVHLSLVDFGQVCPEWTPLTGSHSEGIPECFPLHYQAPEIIFGCFGTSTTPNTSGGDTLQRVSTVTIEPHARISEGDNHEENGEEEDEEEEGSEEEEEDTYAAQAGSVVSGAESWALGCLLYFMATGEDLFIPKNPVVIEEEETEFEKKEAVLLRWLDELGSQPIRNVELFTSSPTYKSLMMTDAVGEALLLAAPSYSSTTTTQPEGSGGLGLGPSLELLSLRCEAVACAISDLLIVDPQYRPSPDEVLFRHFYSEPEAAPFPSSSFTLGNLMEATGSGGGPPLGVNGMTPFATTAADAHQQEEDEEEEQTELSIPFSMVGNLKSKMMKKLLARCVADLVNATVLETQQTTSEDADQEVLCCCELALSPNALLLGCDIFTLVQAGVAGNSTNGGVLSVAASDRREEDQNPQNEEELLVSVLLAAILLGVKLLEDSYCDVDHSESMAQSLIDGLKSVEISLGDSNGTSSGEGGMVIPVCALLDVAMIKGAEMRILSLLPTLLQSGRPTTTAESHSLLPTFLNGNTLTRFAKNRKLQHCLSQPLLMSVVRQMILYRAGLDEGGAQQEPCIQSYAVAAQKCIENLNR